MKLGWGIFNRNSEEFSAGIDNGDEIPVSTKPLARRTLLRSVPATA